MTTEVLPPGNPFSTRYIGPGAIAYVFSDGEDAAQLVRRLAELGWRAQIIGPHGAGKSTLVASLLEPLAEAGRAAHHIALRDGQRRLPVDWLRQARAARAGTIIVDGYEQLSRWSRWRLARRCRRQGWGLLVTAHEDVGFPTLARLVPSLQIARAVVDQLLVPSDRIIEQQSVEQCFAASRGNVREMLFALYDRYESARRGSGPAPPCM